MENSSSEASFPRKGFQPGNSWFRNVRQTLIRKSQAAAEMLPKQGEFILWFHRPQCLWLSSFIFTKPEFFRWCFWGGSDFRIHETTPFFGPEKYVTSEVMSTCQPSTSSTVSTTRHPAEAPQHLSRSLPLSLPWCLWLTYSWVPLPQQPLCNKAA